jgi:hypothetical protein
VDVPGAEAQYTNVTAKTLTEDVAGKLSPTRSFLVAREALGDFRIELINDDS